MSDPTPPADPPDAAAKRGVPWWAWQLAILTAVPWLLGLLGRWWWFAELATHFRFQCLLGTGAVALVLLIARKWKPLAICGVVALVYGWPMLPRPWENPLAGLDEKSGTVRVTTCNVLIHNRDAAAVLAHIDAADPDVICFQEVDARWLADLAPLHARYAHRCERPRPDPFGAALFSKLPARFTVLDVETLPQIRADVETPAGPLTVFAVHVSPPIGASRAGDRNRALREIAARAGAIDGPVIVCGDLNCTPWSPHFADLLAAGRLSDPRRGGWSPPSWRAENPLFALPIDHLLPGHGARVRRLGSGPDVGSDHRSLTADALLPPRPTPRRAPAG